jgi:uncharacterized protein (DUF924 family)
MVMKKDVLNFWFHEIAPKQWWTKEIAFDELIRNRFLELFEEIKNGGKIEWLDSPCGCLARIIVLDQFPRNMFRDKPESFSTDGLALSSAKHARAMRFDEELNATEKAFVYMPFMHSEAAEDQATSINVFSLAGPELAENLKSAYRHKAIIDQFGRFPHRNTILNRLSTEAELEFLQQPGSRF